MLIHRDCSSMPDLQLISIYRSRSGDRLQPHNAATLKEVTNSNMGGINIVRDDFYATVVSSRKTFNRKQQIMKTNHAPLMAALDKIISSTVVILLFLCAAFTIAGPPVDFSGEWKLNQGKSDHFPAEKLKVETTDDSFVITMFASKGNATLDTLLSSTLNYNGRETTKIGGPRNEEIKSTVHWSGKTMIVENNLGETQEWKLSEDEKELFIVFTGSMGMKANVVYDRVK